MILFYVQGGGLGHLSRTDKLIKYLKLIPSEVVIITPSQFTNFFPQYTFEPISWNDSIEKWQDVIKHTLLKYKVVSCYVDVFLSGIKGELKSIFNQSENIKLIYIARVLKWGKYLNDISEIDNILFDETLVLEPLYPEHSEWIRKNSTKISTIDLSCENLQKPIKLSEKPYDLVIHSGGKKDLKKLCDYAEIHSEADKEIFVFTQVNLEYDSPRFTFKQNLHPVIPYFQHSDKIYTAGGFNLVLELKVYRDKHIALAFDRLYDDQKFRLANINP